MLKRNNILSNISVRYEVVSMFKKIFKTTETVFAKTTHQVCVARTLNSERIRTIPFLIFLNDLI